MQFKFLSFAKLPPSEKNYKSVHTEKTEKKFMVYEVPNKALNAASQPTKCPMLLYKKIFRDNFSAQIVTQKMPVREPLANQQRIKKQKTIKKTKSHPLLYKMLYINLNCHRLLTAPMIRLSVNKGTKSTGKNLKTEGIGKVSQNQKKAKQNLNKFHSTINRTKNEYE